jgi:hypothetical protein
VAVAVGFCFNVFVVVELMQINSEDREKENSRI